MKRWFALLFLLISACAQVNRPNGHGGTSTDDYNPVFPVPAAGTSFQSNLSQFLSREQAAERTEYGFANFVVSGCLGATAAGLTHTPSSCIAYNANIRGTETGSITYPNNSTIWVAMDENTSGANAGLPNFARVAGTHYLIDSVDATQPAMASDSQLLMKVTTAGGAITAVTDLRRVGFSPSLASVNGPISIIGNRTNGADKVSSVNLNNTLNGLTFGMKCDGVTDDAPALTAAILAAQAYTSGGIFSTALYLPPGLCLLKSNITIGTRVPITIVGTGTERTGQVNTRTTLQAGTGDTGDVLTLGDGTNTLLGMNLQNLTIDSNQIAAHCLQIKNHGGDYLFAQNIDCMHSTGIGMLTAAGSANVDMTFVNVKSHDNTLDGFALQGTINNELFVGGQFYYNYQAGSGEQFLAGSAINTRSGPVTFIGTDMEPNPNDVGTDRDLLIEGALVNVYGGYYEAHGTSSSNCIQIQANQTGAPLEEHFIGGICQGGGTSDYAIQLPTTSTSNLFVEVDSFHPFNFLCGGSCTSTHLNPNGAPIVNQLGTDVMFSSRNNGWYPDTQVMLEAHEGASTTGMAGYDQLFANSTTHCWNQNINNTGPQPLSGCPPYSPAYGTTVTPDLSKSLVQPVTVTDGVGWTLANPLNAVAGQVWYLDIFNNSGGAGGAIALGSHYLWDGTAMVPASTKRIRCTVTNETAVLHLVGNCTAGM